MEVNSNVETDGSRLKTSGLFGTPLTNRARSSLALLPEATETGQVPSVPDPANTGRSVEQLLVQFVSERLPFQVPPEVVAEELRLQLVREARHVVCRVRTYDDVLQIPQRALIWQRLLLEHVER